jgi:L-fuconolactonase
MLVNPQMRRQKVKMKIDTHQHFWHFEPAYFPWISAQMPDLRQNFLPPDSRPFMDACAVDAVIAVQARSQSQETDFLLALAAQDPRIAGVVGWVDLAGKELARQLERWSDQPALRGFRHILQDEPELGVLVQSAAFNLGVSRLQKQQFVYDVLVFEHQLPEVIGFCARHDQHTLVLDHVGKPAVRNGRNTPAHTNWQRALRELAAMPHVMCKLSGLVTEVASSPSQLDKAQISAIHTCFDLALDAFGPDRLMFGSDWPVCQLAAPYALVHDIAQTWAASRLNPQAQQAFWGGNAIRGYGLTEPAH